MVQSQGQGSLLSVPVNISEEKGETWQLTFLCMAPGMAVGVGNE
jgi:hypothetical protein